MYPKHSLEQCIDLYRKLHSAHGVHSLNFVDEACNWIQWSREDQPDGSAVFDKTDHSPGGMSSIKSMRSFGLLWVRRGRIEYPPYLYTGLQCVRHRTHAAGSLWQELE